jgi:hypothetical protein
MQIEAKTKEGKGVSFEFNLPETLQGLLDKYGEEQVYNLAQRSAVIAVQALARQHIDKNAEEIEKLANEWQPGVRGPRTSKSPLERAAAALDGMDADAIAALLAKVKEKQKALNKA